MLGAKAQSLRRPQKIGNPPIYGTHGRAGTARQRQLGRGGLPGTRVGGRGTRACGRGREGGGAQVQDDERGCGGGCGYGGGRDRGGQRLRGGGDGCYALETSLGARAGEGAVLYQG